MKKMILALISLCTVALLNEALAQENPVGKVFDQGMLTPLPGIDGSLYAYLSRKSLDCSPEFAATRVFEFDGKSYEDLGSLRELRDPFTFEQKSNSKSGQRNMSKELPVQGCAMLISAAKEITQKGRLAEQRRERRQKLEDAIDSKEAVHCYGGFPFLDRDGQVHMGGAIILNTQKLDHCARLASCCKIKKIAEVF